MMLVCPDGHIGLLRKAGYTHAEAKMAHMARASSAFEGDPTLAGPATIPPQVRDGPRRSGAVHSGRRPPQTA
jgi:hypothetical protein